MVRAQELTLGQALAYLQAEQTAGATRDRQKFSAPEKNYLQALRERLQAVGTRRQVSEIFQALPERCCDQENPHLADNRDFFLASLLVCLQIGPERDDCTRLSKHLNDCFRCFEEFCQVIRDYYRQSRALSRDS